MADAGIGEAMLISAAIGGGTAAATGNDPLKGALLGGALGGLGVGAMGAFGGASAAGVGAEAGAGAGLGAGITEVPTELGGLFQNAQGTLLTQLPSESGALYQNLAGSIYAPTGAAITPTGADMAAQMAKEAAKSPFEKGIGALGEYGSKAIDWAKENPKTALALGAAPLLSSMLAPKTKIPGVEHYSGPLSYFKYDPRNYTPYTPTPPSPPYRAQYASGGITSLAVGGELNEPTGPVERMSQGVIGSGGMYPQSQMDKTYFATPTQMPASAEVIGADYDAKTNPYTGAMMAAGGSVDMKEVDDYIENAETVKGGLKKLLANARADNPNALAAVSRMQNKKALEDQHNMALKSQGIAAIDLAGGGGIGGYSDGGRMLKGPGDGMSDSIPGTIGGKRPARLADGEFVVPADVVSHLGNGSTDAGAKRLYGMMDRVRQARTGTKKQGRQINPNKLMPA